MSCMEKGDIKKKLNELEKESIIHLRYNDTEKKKIVSVKLESDQCYLNKERYLCGWQVTTGRRIIILIEKITSIKVTN
jgi:hypothetical protein